MSANTFAKDNTDSLATQAVFPDPGSGGTISPVFTGQICEITTAGAEDRTLAAATSYPLGFEITVAQLTAGDTTLDSVVNLAAGAGDATLTIAGQWITLRCGKSTAGAKVWRIFASDCATVPS